MLIDDIKSNLNDSRKKKESDKVRALSTFYGEASLIGKNNGNRATTDEEVIAHIKKTIKNATDLLEGLKKTGRSTVDVDNEISILSRYLPVQLSEDEIAAFFESFKSQNPSAKMGDALKAIKSACSGTYDGKTASNIAKSMF